MVVLERTLVIITAPSPRAQETKEKKLQHPNCIEHDTNCLTAVLCDVVQVEETAFLLVAPVGFLPFYTV